MKERNCDSFGQTPVQIINLLSGLENMGARFHWRVTMKLDDRRTASGFTNEVDLPDTIEYQEYYNVGDPVGEPYKGSNDLLGAEGKLCRDVHEYNPRAITAYVGAGEPYIADVTDIEGISRTIGVESVEVSVPAPPGSTNCDPFAV